jgi:hypothetical protein
MNFLAYHKRMRAEGYVLQTRDVPKDVPNTARLYVREERVVVHLEKKGTRLVVVREEHL